LIVGGAIIMVLAFLALDNPEHYEATNEAIVTQSLGVDSGASIVDKLAVLKERKMHMALPRSSSFLPWTALLLGIWILNFYYWGLNQYIMQRTLGAQSLREGQRGVVFAAFLKLIIPFIVCVPGIIAFTLYGPKMQENAMQMETLNKPVIEKFILVKEKPAEAKRLFLFDADFAALNPVFADQIFRFNAMASGVDATADTPFEEVRKKAAAYAASKDRSFQKALTKTPAQNMDISALNDGVVAVSTGQYRPFLKKIFTKDKFPFEAEQGLVGYDYDGAFPLLLRYLTPVGLRGFVLAALMGAVISSLASMLNAGSTIFTMDIYREWFNKDANQKALVVIGRFCVPVLVIIGCLIAPVLANPKFKGAFSFIQEFQGFIAPGILTIFLFGLFVKKAPRICGVLGLLLSPVIYGILFFAWHEMAFLNRMAITVGVIAVVLLIITLIKPLKEAIKLPETTKIELEWSKGSMYFGCFVILLTLALYVVFF